MVYSALMKKFLLVFLFSLAFIPLVHADDAADSVSNAANVQPPSRPQAPGAATGALVDLAGSRTHSDIEDLRGRVTRLEQDLHFQSQRIDGLERDVEDIRRRHLR